MECTFRKICNNGIYCLYPIEESADRTVFVTDNPNEHTEVYVLETDYSFNKNGHPFRLGKPYVTFPNGVPKCNNLCVLSFPNFESRFIILIGDL